MLLEVTLNDIQGLVKEALDSILSEAFQPYETFLPFNMKVRVNSQAEANMTNIINKEARLMLKQGQEQQAHTLIQNFIQTKQLPPNIMAKYGIRGVGRPKGSLNTPKPATKKGRIKGGSNFSTIYQNSVTLKATTGQKAVIATQIPGVKQDPTYIYQYMDDFIYDGFLSELLNFIKKPNNQEIIALYDTEEGNQFSSLYNTNRKIQDILEQFQFTTHENKFPESPYDLLAKLSPYFNELAEIVRNLAFQTTALKKQRVIRNNTLEINAGRHATISFNKLVILDERTSMQYAQLLEDKALYLQQQGGNSTLKREKSAFKKTRR